jgi:hypothetical protein
MDGSRQRKWLALAERYQKATPEQQQRMQERMQAWATITPEQRQKARENFQAVRKLDPNTRSQKWSSYEQLPAEKRIELHNQVEAKRQMPPAPVKTAPAGAMSAKSAVIAVPADHNTLLPAAAKPAASSSATQPRP